MCGKMQTLILAFLARLLLSNAIRCCSKMKRKVLFIPFSAGAPCETGPETFHTDDEALLHHHHHIYLPYCKINFKDIYSMLLGEETSGNHQAYRRGHLDITILNEIRAAKECGRN